MAGGAGRPHVGNGEMRAGMKATQIGLAAELLGYVQHYNDDKEFI